MNYNEVHSTVSSVRHGMNDLLIMYYGKSFRRPKKSRDEDCRRKYSILDDMKFIERYKQLGCNQSALARECGVSQPAVRKRLIRAGREQAKSAAEAIALLQWTFKDFPRI